VYSNCQDSKWLSATLCIQNQMKMTFREERIRHQRRLNVKRMYVMQALISGPSSLPPVFVTVVSVTLIPFHFNYTYFLTAARFIFTANSLCAFGINSKHCDPSSQLVKQTAAACRAEKAVHSESQLIICLPHYLYGLSIRTAPSKKKKWKY